MGKFYQTVSKIQKKADDKAYPLGYVQLTKEARSSNSCQSRSSLGRIRS